MLNFQDNKLTKAQFLDDYWQKKPLLIKNALPGFKQPLSAGELAGLALEEDVDSKIIIETPKQTPQWHLKTGPFVEDDFNDLPKSNWTLLVQGVDKIIPEINIILDNFNFLPQWRVDDIMISFASLNGSVGPHYDNYDVFLYQASGRRKWSLTTKNCHETNAIPELDLRIMAEFEVEQEFILEAGDMLYLPPHIGHHGISLSDASISYSFGYRSYQGQELWDSFGDYLSEHKLCTQLYQDPNWNILNNTAQIPNQAYQQAKKLMSAMLDDEQQFQQWFSRFATQLDQQSSQLVPLPLEPNETSNLTTFINDLKNSLNLSQDLNCRFAYHIDDGKINLFINGYPFDTYNAEANLVILIACNRCVPIKHLSTMIEKIDNQNFLYQLWLQQHLSLES